MARPRKPASLLELSGAYRKNPGRRHDPAPTPSAPLGDPPDRLPAEARVFWFEIAAMCPPGLLGSSDRWALEIIARLMEKAVCVPNAAAVLELAKAAELTVTETRALFRRETISGSELSILNSLLGRFGLTPADRAKLSVPISKPKNRFAELAASSRRPN